MEFDVNERVQMRFSEGQGARSPKYKGWPSEVPGPSSPQGDVP